MRTAKMFAEETQPVMLPETTGLEVNEACRPVATARVPVSVDKTPRPRLLSRRLARQARRAAR